MNNNITALLAATWLLFACNKPAEKQAPAPSPVSKDKSTTELNTVTKKELGIEFPIFKTYKYSDKSGNYQLVLTESRDSIKDKDTINLKIKAFNFKETPGGLNKEWEVNDFALPTAADHDGEETIWFWTKYLNLKDIDKDGLADVIMTYGTNGINGYDDGRIKILLWHKGQKIAIRHQNGVLDEQRNTQVDPKFYKLPAAIQKHVKALMDKMDANQVAIFPYGWQDAMKKHETDFDEN